MTDIKLKPCPFCGGEAIVFVAQDHGVRVACINCVCGTFWAQDSSTAVFANKPSAIARVVDAWNRRMTHE